MKIGTSRKAINVRFVGNDFTPSNGIGYSARHSGHFRCRKTVSAYLSRHSRQKVWLQGNNLGCL